MDPTSICFGCHQTLTPLAFQRQKWADDGTYRETDVDLGTVGFAVQDLDHDGVPDVYEP